MEPIFVVCPQCQDPVEIVEVNCAIFRHGVFRNNGQQIPPHSSELDCKKWQENNELYGCGKPFKLVKNENNEYIAEKCSYNT